jgi:hypothetical protein
MKEKINKKNSENRQNCREPLPVVKAPQFSRNFFPH